MKKVLLSLAAFTVLTLSAGAQVQREQKDKMQQEKMGDRQGMGMRHHSQKMNNAKMMMQKLNFTDQQKQQLKDMHQEFKAKNEELNKNDGITVKEFREKKKVLMEERKSKMQGILTPEQKAKMEEFVKAGKERREFNKDGEGKGDPSLRSGGKPGMQRGPENMEKMKTDLGLTTDQVTKIQANRESFKEKAQAIRSNDALTQDQKKEQFKALTENMKKDMKSILTAEQMKKLEDNRGNRPQ